jgi:hypothetical protein
MTGLVLLFLLNFSFLINGVVLVGGVVVRRSGGPERNVRMSYKYCNLFFGKIIKIAFRIAKISPKSDWI